MRFETGNLWDWHANGYTIVISTNIGWDVDYNYANNMGAGIALQASDRWPDLPEWLGKTYHDRHAKGEPQLPIERPDLRLIFLAAKPLKPEDPSYSWAQKASVPLIAEQLKALAFFRGKLALGYVGCGNGALEQHRVKPLIIGLARKRALADLGETVLVDKEHHV